MQAPRRPPTLRQMRSDEHKTTDAGSAGTKQTAQEPLTSQPRRDGADVRVSRRSPGAALLGLVLLVPSLLGVYLTIEIPGMWGGGGTLTSGYYEFAAGSIGVFALADGMIIYGAAIVAAPPAR